MNVKQIEIGRIGFETEVPLNAEDGRLLRGYILNLFRDSDLLHNHDLKTGKCQYRYPVVQYKVVRGKPMILAIGKDAIEIARSIFCGVRDLRLHGKTVGIKKSEMKIDRDYLGISLTLRTYRFITPWLGLNSENYRKYCESSNLREEILRRCLTGNILGVCKYLDYHVDKSILVKHDLQVESVILKREKMLGFRGFFVANFYLPELIGIGKSCSRGYGCCSDITEQSELVGARF